MEIRYEMVKKRPYTEKSLLEDLSFIKFTNDIRYRKVQLRIQQNLLELFYTNVSLFIGDSDVDDIVMLVTLLWWLISDVGDRIIMLAIFFRYVT